MLHVIIKNTFTEIFTTVAVVQATFLCVLDAIFIIVCKFFLLVGIKMFFTVIKVWSFNLYLQREIIGRKIKQ